MLSGTHPALDDLNLGGRRRSLAEMVASARASTGANCIELGAHPPVGGEPVTGEGDVLGVCVLWSSRWTVDALADLARRLTAEGMLVIVEPVADIGWRRLTQWLLTPWWRVRLGYTFNRDLPADLRAAGFVLTDIDRFAAGSAGIRTYLHARAVPAATPR